ncbi:thioredoxin-like protein [Lutibacter sp. Hel_I_33_5]|uniref:TlpA family protein disulfide reductase n=1 Tax=Lutibacter sp. Hel_I_33_5 TaxID=1566289 RepID=UPI0011A47D77|nr:TlpA disulfide reductase family protein [Lutibacter sp. Hel_I_33_5]TVZ57302.1 thioredoxin-like protein [Lutibacter sp. Hel_I_33_5]
MKKIIVLVLTISFFSCQKEKNFNEIICNVENQEGLELVFSINGEDFENRQIQKIKNGKVIFKSFKHTTEVGYIESSYNLDKHNNQRRFVKLLPENNTMNLNFTITKDSTEIDSAVFAPIYSFRNVEYKNNGINKEYVNYSDKKQSFLKGIIYSNSKKDSLNQYVFPEIKRKLLNLYEEKIKESQNEMLQIEILSNMLNGWAFESNGDITEEEKTKINLFFNQIKISPDNNSFYKLQEKFNEISKIDRDKIEFSEFILEDINNQKQRLSKLIENNKFTVLYFWTAACGPCRSFNEKLNSKNKILNDNGIEIIHISVDIQRKDWKRASEEDSIFWTNLYAGKNLELHKKYNIRWWPTKIVFNKKKELIDFEFNNPEDLLKLLKC